MPHLNYSYFSPCLIVSPLARVRTPCMRHSMIRTTFFSFYSFFSFPHSFLIHSWLWVRRYSCNSLKLILLLLNKNELACVSLFHYGLIFTVNSIAWRKMCCLLRIDCHFDVIRKKLCLCVWVTKCLEATNDDDNERCCHGAFSVHTAPRSPWLFANTKLFAIEVDELGIGSINGHQMLLNEQQILRVLRRLKVEKEKIRY